jgi:hypothetical protein
MKRILGDISIYQNELCKLFAEYSVSSNIDEYKRRNQYDEDKIKQDIYNGKKAEFLVFEYLLSMNKHKPSIPDIMIYPKHMKSFEQDMIYDIKKLHIKSCLNDNSFPNSWLFQPNDILTTNPCVDEYIVFVVIGVENYCYIEKADSLIDKYKKPLKVSLNKKVIYEKDL